MANAVSQRLLASVPAPAAGENELCARVRSYGVILTLVPADRGVVLEGISPTFYGKQMAQELARQARLVVVANRITVDRMAGCAFGALSPA